jgi:hypothetical protein
MRKSEPITGRAKARIQTEKTPRARQADETRPARLDAGAGGGPLVHIRNSPLSAAGAGLRSVVDSETGEILVVRQGHDCTLQVVASAAEARGRRFYRLEVARGLLGTRHRVNACHRVPAKFAQAVEVWRKHSQGECQCGAHFKGLMVCGSVWLCAVCGSKISERRRAELQTAIALWQAEGGVVWLATYTFSHGRHDVLAETLDKLANARRKMKRGMSYDAIRKDFGTIGTVQAFEITHGPAHGWHPHIHELVFLRAGCDMAEFRNRMYEKWRRACIASGLGEPSFEHGFDVRGGEEAARYVSKGVGWGLDQEMTKGHIKDGRGKNRSPGQLLDCAADPLADEAHRAEAGRLWLDYAKAMKGKQQLRWTPGLKARFAVADLTDDEIAAQVEEDAILLARISLDDWHVIARHKLQASVLALAEAGGAEAIDNLIAAYRGVTR